MDSLKNSILFVCFTLVLCIIYCQANDDRPQGPSEAHFFHGVQKADFDKCLEEAGLTKDDLKAYHESPSKEPSTKQLCLAKCLGTSSGMLKDGMIVPDIIKKNVPSFIDDNTVETAIKCMDAAGKINTCEDMSKILKCIPKPPKRPE
nr:odorant binding protein 7 [Pachyrhinus yasumatsui]